jgi:hypothetical protein
MSKSSVYFAHLTPKGWKVLKSEGDALAVLLRDRRALLFRIEQSSESPAPSVDSDGRLSHHGWMEALEA